MKRIKKIKNYLLVVDAFGGVPIISLQHLEKGFEDAYTFSVLSERLIDRNLLKIIEHVELLVSGEVVYQRKKNINFIDELKVTKVRVCEAE